MKPLEILGVDKDNKLCSTCKPMIVQVEGAPVLLHTWKCAKDPEDLEYKTKEELGT